MRRIVFLLLLAVGLAAALPQSLPAQRGQGKPNREHAGGGGKQVQGSSARGGQVRGSTARGRTERGQTRARAQTVRRAEGKGRSVQRSTLTRRATDRGSGSGVRAERGAGRGAGSGVRGGRRTGSGTGSRAIRWTDRRERFDGFRLVDARGRNGLGPSFCRNGRGHPVYGRSWCLDKGFGLGRDIGVWRRAPWDTVRFLSYRRTGGSLARDLLVGVLGSVVLNRLTYGVSDPVTGYWSSYDSGPMVLQLNSGYTPIAELTDFDRDGRVDMVLLNTGSY
ncbi:MAG TPA: hypothetical protein VF746_24245 [Longimicrobium sp.]|jgi:hypothetical protein